MDMDEVDFDMNIFDLSRMGKIAARRGHPSAEGFFSTQVSKARVFYRDPRALRGPLIVWSAGCEHCSGSYRIDRKDFAGFCIEFVAGGEGSVIVSGDEHRIGPGSVFTYGPGTAYTMRSDVERPLIKHFVDFRGPEARRHLAEGSLSPGTLSQISPSLALEIRDLYERLIDAGLSTSPRAPRLATLLLETLIVRCADGRMPLPGSAADTLAFATYRRCREKIDDSPALFRQTRDAARACNIDEAYLCRLFQRFAGVSPLQHLTRLRINAATQRLIEHGSLIKDVAEEFGFADPYHFSRTFKKFCGVSPQKFLHPRHQPARNKPSAA